MSFKIVTITYGFGAVGYNVGCQDKDLKGELVVATIHETNSSHKYSHIK